jgi:hypothetical protein
MRTDNENDGLGPDFGVSKKPLEIAEQFNEWLGWLIEQGYSPISINAGATIALADFGEFLHDTFEEDADERP